MKNYEWKSDFAPLIHTFLEQYRLAGYKFERQERILQHFDHFCMMQGYTGLELKKYVLEEFVYDKREQKSTHYAKEVVMQQFADFMIKRGYSAWRIGHRHQLPRSKYIPHIYTTEEKQRFFHAVDHYPVTKLSYRNDVDPELFRFLCCTGARLSEALNLKKDDYDPEKGTVFIRGAKNDRDRIIPLSLSLNKRLNKYVKRFLTELTDEAYLFPSIAGGKMDKSTAYVHFRDYLLMADIPHNDKGPRIHDFRHCLAVENLRRWAKEGADMSNKLPYLSAYMGHSDFRATQYYLRLTAEIYPEMVEMMEEAGLDIIPEGVFEDYAEN